MRLDVDMITVVFLRAAFVSIVLGTFLILKNGVAGLLKISRRHFLLFSFSGFLTVVLTGGGFLLSLKYLSVPVALILHYAFPLVTMIGSIIFLREKPTVVHFISGVLVLLGLWMGMSGEASLSAAGIFCGLVSVLGIAGQSILARYLARPDDDGKTLDRNILLFYCMFTGAVLMGIIKFLTVGMGDVPQIFESGEKFFLVVLQAVFGNLLPYWAYFTSLRYISASTASLICTSEIVVAMSIAAVWFGTAPSVNEIIGVCIIIGAIAISSRSETNKSEQSLHEA